MISQKLFLENSFCIGQKLIPVLALRNLDLRINFSTYPVIRNQSKASVSKHVRSSVPSSFGKKAKEATKTTYYTAVVVAGFGAFGLMMYAIYKELMSSFSPQSVYTKAVNKISSDSEVIRIFGDNIKCFGETSRRGRRQHIANLPYEMDGKKGMRIKFYLQGQYRAGTVHLDAVSGSSGLEFRYLFVQSDSYPHDVVVVEDNRSSVDNQQVEQSTGSSLSDFSSMPSLPSLRSS